MRRLVAFPVFETQNELAMLTPVVLIIVLLRHSGPRGNDKKAMVHPEHLGPMNSEW